MLPDTPCKCHGGWMGLFSLNGIFKAGCFAGLITANHTWGAECGFAELLSFSRKCVFSNLELDLGWWLVLTKGFSCPCSWRGDQMLMPGSEG